MAIPNKLKHKLVRLLANLVRDKKTAMTYAEHGELDTTAIEFDDMALVNWDRIVDHADDNNKLEGLLEIVLESFGGNAELKAMYEEIKNGFDQRVVKIAKAIKLNQCVLFLGPQILQCLHNNTITPFNQLFSLELAAELDKEGVYYDKEQAGELSYIAQRYEEMPTFVNGETGHKAQKSFAAATKHKGVHEQIAKFAFPLVINTNPDDILDDLYKNNNIPFSGSYYDMSNDMSNSGSMTPGATIIYNIFGSFQNPFTILFTDTDKVKFAKNVVKNDPPIPPLIKKMLENRYYLFIGFNFDEWHLKILIDSLGLAKKEDRSFALSARLNADDEQYNEYFEKEYKFYFINKEMEKFLGQIDEAYQKI
jgi:SIR2-like domain